MTDRHTAPSPWIPPLHRARRCGARTRGGTACKGAAVAGKARCRMHGGAAGVGAPRGNRNAERTGYWSAASRETRRRRAALARAARALLREAGDQ